MVITAKYPSRCATCQQSIAVGARIEWSKGQPARHVACAATSPSPSPSAPSRRSNSQRSVERTYRRRYGWDGVRGSSSYYSSGMYDEES
jgi:hypothetical protein